MQDVVKKIAAVVARSGGKAFLVGGTVRDRLLGRSSKDIDLEIFGLPIDQIEKAIAPFGQINRIGKQFAILQLTPYNPQPIPHAPRPTPHSPQLQIAAPRRETKTAAGHRGFAIDIDPTLSPAQAARRRDFTINAMLLDPLTDELVDPFAGQVDLKNRILRMVDAVTFVEDPLRLLRACQLTGRFGLQVEPQTFQVLHAMVPKLNELPAARLAPEWTKLLLQSQQPSIGFDLAQRVGYFAQSLPEMDQLAQTPQNPKHHPEGNVWQHSLLAVDEAARLVRLYHADPEDQLVVLLATWLHDIGKAKTTTQEDGNWIAHGHAEVGAPIVQRWLPTQGFSNQVVEVVTALVREHMHLQHLETLQVEHKLSDGALRRLVNRLPPARPDQLVTVREADARASGPMKPEESYAPRTWFPERLRNLGLAAGPNPVLRGQDLLDLGWPAGHEIGQVLEAAEQYAEAKSADRSTVLELVRAAGSPAAAVQQLRLTAAVEK